VKKGAMFPVCRVYQLQSGGYCFTSVEKLLQAVGGEELVQMTGHPIGEALQKIGIGQRFLNEVVTPILRLGSGQSVNINAFVGTSTLDQLTMLR